MNRIYIVLLALTALWGCKPEKQVQVPNAHGVYVVNEGNFNFGTAEISFYNPATHQVSNGLFTAANNYALGDVAQSLYIQDSTGFIVVNNSQKIEVVKIPSFKKIRTITIPASSPRYFLPVNDSLAYVTDLYAGKLHVINYNTGALVTQIPMPTAWSERMVKSGNTVMVEVRELSGSHTHNAGMVAVNCFTHSITATRRLSSNNINGIGLDASGNVWVSTGADSVAQRPGVLFRLNSSYTVLDSVVFSGVHSAGSLYFNAAGNTLYFLDGDVYSMPAQAGAAPQVVIARNGRNFYGLGIDPANGDIYVADALDYVQPSHVYRYSSNGDLIDSFTAGLIAGNFTFNYE